MHDRVTYVRDAQGFYLDVNGRPLPPHRTREPQWLAAHGVVDEDLSEILKQWQCFRAEYGEDYLW